MMYAERHAVALVTNGSQVATGYTPNITGEIVSIQYVKTDFADGVDFVVTGEATNLPIWTGTNVNAAVTVYPVAPAVVVAGTASTLTERPLVVVNERIKVAVAQGGETKSGVVYVVVR
jgi:hypothetical protein